MKNSSSNIHSARISFGIIWVLVFLVTAGVEGFLSWRIMKSESLASAQQSMGDTASALALHYRSEFDLLVQQLSQFREKLHSQRSDMPLDDAASGNVSSTLDMSPTVLDVSLWKRAQQREVFDLAPVAKRASLALNSHYANFSEDYLQQLRAAEEQEKSLVSPAFMGNTILVAAPPPLKEKGVAAFILPQSGPEGEVVEVLVAHLRLDHFQSALQRESAVLIVLVDDLGNVLAHPESKFVNQVNLSQTALFQKMHSSKMQKGAPNGQANFQGIFQGLYQGLYNDEKNISYLGAYSRIDTGNIAVLASISEEAATSGLKVLISQLVMFGAIALISLTLIGYFVAHRWVGFQMVEESDSKGEPALEAEEEPQEKAPAQAESAPQTPAKVPAAEVPGRWLVNNGSQIIGPLTPHEIAMRLFEQELDFDCECWTEGTGNSAEIKTAGIFSGSNDEGSTLWAFDGETVHGPISPGFLKTALIHGALKDQIHLCEGSTVNGWKTLEQWDPTFLTTPTTDSEAVEAQQKTVA